MKFEDTKLPRHPVIEQALAAANAFYGNDQNSVFKESLWIARLLAHYLTDANPATIGAALVAPITISYGAPLPETLDRTLKDTVKSLAAFAPGKSTFALVLAGLAAEANNLRKTYADDLELTASIDGDMKAAYAAATEGHRKGLLEMLRYLTPKEEIMDGLKDEPKLVEAYKAIVANADEFLSTPAKAPTAGPESAAKSKPNAPAV